MKKFFSKKNLKNFPFFALFLSLLFMGLSFLGGTFVYAAETKCNWIKDGSGGWFDSVSNWSCGAFPDGAEYNVDICNTSASGNITVTATTSITLGRLQVGSTTSTCNSRIHTVDINDGANVTITNSEGFTEAGFLNANSRGRYYPGTGTTTIFGRLGSTVTSSLQGIQPETATYVFDGLTGHFVTTTDNSTLVFYKLVHIQTSFWSIAYSTPISINHQLVLNGAPFIGFLGNDSLSFPSSSINTTPVVLRNGVALTPVTRIQFTALGTTHNIPPFTANGIDIGRADNAGGAMTLTLTGDITATSTGFRFYGNHDTNVSTLTTAGYDLDVQYGTTQLGEDLLGVNVVYYPSRIDVTGNSTASFHDFTAYENNGESAAIQVHNGNTVNFSGDIDMVNGAETATFSFGTSTVNLVATSTDQTIDMVAGNSFYDLVVNHTGSTGNDDVIFTNNVDVDNDLTLTDGDLDIDTNDATLTIGGDFTVGLNGAWTRTNESLTFDGTTTYTDNSGVFNLGEFTIASSSAAATFTLGSNATSSGIVVGSGETLAIGSNTLYLTDATGSSTPLTVNGTFTPGTGTVNYKATSTQTTIEATQYNNLTLGGAASFVTEGVTTVTGTFTNSAGYLNEATGYISASSSAALDATSYETGDTVTLTVTDYDANISATSTDSIVATTTIATDTETVTLTETGNATGVFTGTITLATGSVTTGDGTLDFPIGGNDTLTLTFIDSKESIDISTDTATVTHSASQAAAASGSSSSSSTGSVAVLPPSFSQNTGSTPITPTQPSTGSSLSNSQITSIITLLTSFNVDQITLETVRRILEGNQSQQTTYAIDVSQLTGPFQVNQTTPQNRLLQQILAQDPTIYPEGLITGYYGTLTTKAVERFQIRHTIAGPDHPAYGYAGPQTRAKMREVFEK
ncbi:hypothetical protein CL654_02140 [bacterium]|nr:hypothetical protein [bacterium]